MNVVGNVFTHKLKTFERNKLNETVSAMDPWYWPVPQGDRPPGLGVSKDSASLKKNSCSVELNLIRLTKIDPMAGIDGRLLVERGSELIYECIKR